MLYYIQILLFPSLCSSKKSGWNGIIRSFERETFLRKLINTYILNYTGQLFEIY